MGCLLTESLAVILFYGDEVREEVVVGEKVV